MHKQKMRSVKGAGILDALQATEIVESRSRLPAEILVLILDYLPVAAQMRMACTSRRLQEMVYDDTRWVSRLKCMNCWDESEARRRFESSLRRRREANERASRTVNGNGVSRAEGTLFDASTEEQRRKRAVSDLRDGFQTMALGGSGQDPPHSADSYLNIFRHVRSIRGGARQEYGKIYHTLAPFYWDTVKAKIHTDPIVFQAFRDPEQQAQMLANLLRFAKSDWAPGCSGRSETLASMTHIFETAVLREFEQGYEAQDVDGKMRRYAHVLHTLDKSRGGIDLFIQKHAIFSDRDLIINPTEGFVPEASDELSLEPSRQFFEMLLSKINEQSEVVARVFPDSITVFWEFVEKVREDIVMEYLTSVFDECHQRGAAVYLRAISGLFEQTMRFFLDLLPPPGSDEDGLSRKAKELSLKTFEPHLDLYLQEELEFFTKHAETEVSLWEKKLSEQDSSLESFYMSNINRSAEKKDFLSSFKKVVMMPVTALPSFPIGSSSAPSSKNPPAPLSTSNASRTESRSPTPVPASSALSGRASPLPSKAAPTDELAAKAAIMASKLEGIKSLCSIEFALNLVHAAKVSLGRAAALVLLGGQVGGEAREQCANIFIALLRILGQRHVKMGFDTAVDHLSHYNPRNVNHEDQKGVAPLVTFIELVNVGDLISQMVDVFYEQQLATPKIADKNDFMDPTSLAKRKFEQMLDESVAAGLNKGIDVLMAEVEYLHATVQKPTDYNPPLSTSTDPTTGEKKTAAAALAEASIGPTPTARRIVDLLSSHTKMLVGTTDKAMLDVFNGEVGLRLFTALCKHLKRQRISTAGAVTLIADMNLHAEYVRTLRHQDLVAYFAALRELSQIYLIDATHARDMAAVIADSDRFGGVFRAEEVYEYAQRRADWYQIRRGVERAMYGMECAVM